MLAQNDSIMRRAMYYKGGNQRWQGSKLGYVKLGIKSTLCIEHHIKIGYLFTRSVGSRSGYSRSEFQVAAILKQNKIICIFLTSVFLF
jgi:hypothetical protein